MAPALFFFLRIILLGVFCGSMCILGFFYISVKNAVGILVGNALNL